MTLPVPINRTELYLAKIAGEDVTIPDRPINNTEVFLARLAGADIVLPTPINTLQVWLAILCGELYTMPPVQGAELIGVQMVRTEFLAASAGLDGVTTPTPENRAEEYWAKIAEEMAVHTITVKGTSLHLLHVVSGIEDFQYVYGDTEQQKYTGKNKINVPDSSNTNNGITWTIENGVIHGVGKLTATYSNAYGHADLNLPAGEYTFSIAEALPSPLKIEFTTRDNDNNRKNWSILVGQTNMTHEFTNGLAWTGISLVGGTVDQEIDITITDLQIELGSTPTSYEPYVGGTASPNPDYPQDVHVVTGNQTVTISDGNTSTGYSLTLGSLELCKIGDYQDYIYKSGDDWYVHKATGEVVLDGTENWGFNANSSLFRFIKSDAALFPVTNTPPILSDYYMTASFNDLYDSAVGYGISLNNNNHWVCIRNKDIPTVAGFKTWLSTHNTTVYYALATATDTKITDATLVSQLNALDSAILPIPEAFVTVSGNLPAPIQFTYQGKL